MKKVVDKQCDLIAANDVSAKEGGFASDHNELFVYDSKGLVERIPLMLKLDAARRLLQLAAERMSGSETK